MRYRPTVFLVIGFLAVMFSSCSSYKKIPYLQYKGNPDSIRVTLPSVQRGREVRFMVGDVLGITVNANTEPSLVADFNLPFQPSATPDNTGMSDVPQGQGRQTYLVNQFGEIDFPILGKIQVGGLTRDQLETQLKEKLQSYLKMEPMVTIRLLNYHISVLGEVGRPGQYGVSRDRINILEALSLAGDMTIYGRRDNVRIMRELPGEEELQIITLDLSDAWVASSPNFYLQQNDIVYVEPNKTKSKASDIGAQTSLLVSLGSILLSIASLVILVTK